MFDLKEFHTHNFHDGIITGCQNRNGYSVVWGEYPEDEAERSGYRYFHFLFRQTWPPLPGMEDAEILSIEVEEDAGREDNGYSVRICAQNDSFILAEFVCRDISLKSGELDLAGWDDRDIC